MDVFAFARPVEELETHDLSGFERHVRTRQPALVRGLARAWPALTRWTPDYFREQHGNQLLDGYRTAACDLEFDDRTGLVPIRVRCAEFMDELGGAEPPRRRVRDGSFRRRAGLEADAPVPELVQRRLRLSEDLWISAAGTRSALHFDQPENLLVQIRGTKRVALFPPEESRLLYPHPFWSPLAQFSRADVAEVDSRRFPRLLEARAAATLLTPGDALYIPGGHWHYLDAEEVTISLGFRWWRSSALPRLLLADVYKRWRGHAR